MSSIISAAVQQLLRAPDEVKAVLETSTIPDFQNEVALQQNRRVLAIISHKDDWDLSEEASLFICKFKASTTPNVDTVPDELVIQRVLPIYGAFALTLSQTRRTTMDLSNPLKPAVNAHPRTVVSLNIIPAEGVTSEGTPPVAFFTQDVDGLRVLMRESKRLKDASDVDPHTTINIATSGTHFAWLRSYMENRATLSMLPQDIRLLNTPLHERLSPASAGMVGDDHTDAQLIKEDWVRREARQAATIGRRRLNIRIGTFNVNGKMPTQDLSAWVLPRPQADAEDAGKPELPPVQDVSPLSMGEVLRNPFTWNARRTSSISGSTIAADEGQRFTSVRVDENDPDDPDLLVLGFQELDLSTEALIYNTGTVREDAWCTAVLAGLGEKAVNYEKLTSKQLVGMLIVIFVKKNLKDCFTDVKTSTAGAGILGVMGNKGGTAVRLTFTPPAPSIDHDKTGSKISPWPTTLTFVNAHLAAFDEMYEKRNTDFLDLSRRLNFGGNPDVASSANESSAEDSEETKVMGASPRISIYESDALFWLGDLNYRVDLADSVVRKTLQDGEWDNTSKFPALLRFDQLKKAIRTTAAFDGFLEPEISHMPTYRFSPGLMMDKLGYDMKRKPAWTDRILYMHSPTCAVTPVAYTGHPQIYMSDHRPLAANFIVDMDLCDTDALKHHAKSLLPSVDRIDGEAMHDRGWLKLQDLYVDFGKVQYGVPVRRAVRVTNPSKVPCAFRLVPPGDDAPIHPEWLSINCMTGVLLPGETLELVFTVDIDAELAGRMNQRPRDLSCTVILHTVLGKDHFISVGGEYLYTCFANSLSRLTRLRGPIRSLTSPNDLLPENNSINAPREIMRLVNWMMSCNTYTRDMFISAADAGVMQTIRECLDTGDEFPYKPETSNTQIVVAFSRTLLALLASLLESIVPPHLQTRCLDMTNRDEAFELLDGLLPAAVNVWISVTAFLHFMCQTMKDPAYTQQIATTIAPVLIRDSPSSPTLPISPAAKRDFLLYFIS